MNQSLATFNPKAPNWLARGVRWLIYILFLTTPFIFTWVNEELFEFPKIIWVYGLVILAQGLSLADRLIQRSWQWPKTKFDWLIAFFAGSQTLATIFSIHPRTSWFGYYTRFNGGLLSILAYISLYYLIVKYFNSQQLVRLVKITILVAGIAVIYAIPEHFGFSPSCALITKTYDVSCWVQDVKTRVFGTFGQPNWLAAYLITILPLSLAWFTTAKQAWKKILLGLLAILFLAGLLFTKSRSGILGLSLGMSVGLSLMIWWRIWQEKLQLKTHNLQKIFAFKWPELGLLIASCCLILWYGTPFSPSLAELLNKNLLSNPVSSVSVPNQAGTKLDLGGTESGEIRKIVWSGAIAVWRRYPIFGSGPETFAYSYYQDRLLAHNYVSEWDFLYNKAHNELLNYLATSGLVGLLAYLSLWLGLVWAILIWLKSAELDQTNKNLKIFCIAWLAGLAAQFVSNFFGFSTVMINLLFWLGLACVAIWTAPKLKEIPLKNSIDLKLNIVELLVLGIILFGTWWLAIKPISWWLADKDFALSKALFTNNTYQVGLSKLETAIKLSPNEALFWDELANQYSRLAMGLQASPEASQSSEIIAQLTQAAIAASDQTLALNPRHLDFYKTRAKVFINLSQIDSKYLAAATATLITAKTLSPTDPKLAYHLGLVELSNGATTSGLIDLEKSIQLKPDYLSAWFDLGKAYDQTGQPAKAKQTFEHILEKLSPENPEVKAALATLNLKDLTK